MIIDLTDKQIQIIQDFLSNWQYYEHRECGDEFVNNPDNEPYFDLDRKLMEIEK